MARLKKEASVVGVIIISMLTIASSPVAGTLQTSQSISSQGTINNGTLVSWLHTSGIFIYDDVGRRTNLYAINMQYGQGSGVALSDIQNVKAQGFNTMRLHVYWGLLQPYNETLNGVDTSYFTTARSPLQNSIDNVINWAAQNNMYVELCIVWTPSYPVPSWAFPGITDDGQRIAALINGSASRERTGFVNLWQFIANRYKDNPNVIFEIMNEPFASDASLAGNSYKTFNEQVITAMESVETISHLKIVEFLSSPPGYEEVIDTALDINKQNVLWASHMYAPMNNWDPSGTYWVGSFTWNGKYIPGGWVNATTYVAYRIVRCADKAHSWNKPMINTEFSKVITQFGWDVWFNAVLKTHADQNATGWALFCYCNNLSLEPGWNIYDPTTGHQIMAVVTPYMVQP